MEVPTVDDLALTLAFTRVDFLYVVLGVLDYNLVRLSIKPVNDCYLVALSVLNPPGVEANTLNIV